VNYLSQSSADGQRAVDAFRRATSLDPNHAAAHAGLARGLFTLGFLGTTSHQEARVMALTEVNRALAIDPDSAEAHAARADLQFYYDWDWAGAEHSYKRAIDLNGSFARARSQYARFLSAAGRSENAVLQASQATEIDPTSASAASTRAMALYYAGDYPGASQAIEHALALESGSASAYLVQSRIDEARGDLAAALLAAERALAIAGDGASTAWRVHVIRLRALLGEREKARTALGQLSSDVAAGRRRVSTMQFALAHAALGDREQALQFFERALEEREPDMLWLAVDPRVQALRSEPRLQQVVGKLGIPR
jgi:tetratricopeptide (TPR) repeat protein